MKHIIELSSAGWTVVRDRPRNTAKNNNLLSAILERIDMMIRQAYNESDGRALWDELKRLNRGVKC